MTCGQWNTQSSCRLPRRTTPHALHRAPAAQLLTLQHALALMAHGLSRSGITSTHRQPELQKYLPPRTSLPMRSPAAAHSWPPARAARRGPARDHSRPQDLGRWLKAHAHRQHAPRARLPPGPHRPAHAPPGSCPSRPPAPWRRPAPHGTRPPAPLRPGGPAPAAPRVPGADTGTGLCRRRCGSGALWLARQGCGLGA